MKNNNKHTLSRVTAALSLALLFQTASAGNITDINVSTLPDNQKIIKIRFDRDAAMPSGFVTAVPARIALDFDHTGLSLPQPVLEYADPLLHQITAAQNDNRARIVLGLNKTSRYNAEIRDNEVWIFVDESADSNATPAVSRNDPVSDGIQNPNSRQAKYAANIDFRKGLSQTGIVELTADSFNGTPVIKKEGSRLVITLKNHRLPAAAQRNFDVRDFNTPVSTVSLKRNGNATQLVIRAEGNWQFDSQRAGGRYLFKISPQTAAEAGLASRTNPTFSGRRISLDFQDIDVRTVLQILAKESGTNIIASDSVKGKMTLSLKDVPWDQALDLVMQARNLDMRRQGNIINIAPREEFLANDKALLQSEKEISELGQLYSQTFQLKYKNVDEFRKILNLDDKTANSESSRNTLLSPRGSVLIDSSTNTLILTDNRTVIEKFRRLVEELDVAARQVMVEARIVEARDGFSRDLGVKFGYSGINGRNSWGSSWSNALGNAGIAYQNSLAMHNANATGSQTLPALTPLNLIPNISLPATTASASVALVRSIASGALGLEIAASEEQGKSKTISNPRVLTQDRREAKIESGTEIPYQEATSSGATSITFKKAVLGLTVTPNITPDGHIIMAVKINKDTPTDCTVDSMVTKCISTKNLSTQAMVENGGTLVVGGIYEEEDSNAVSKVPLLGDIPLVGNLFKSRGRSQTRRELLIFITPRIMDSAGNNLRY